MEQSIQSILRMQVELEERKQALKNENKEVFRELENIESAEQDLETAWGELRSVLEKNDDYDIHEADLDGYHLRISLSKTVKVVVDDINNVPEEFVEVKKVAKEKALSDYYKLYGECPAGCIDKSFTRFTKKIEKK